MAGEGPVPALRAAAPAGLELPEHPEVRLWRPAVRTDLGALWELNRAMSLADHPNHITTRAGLDSLFQLSYFRPARDSLLGFDAAGRMIASGMAMTPPGYETLARSIIFGGVHPERRGQGIGAELLAWQLGRARQQLESTPDDVSRWVVAFSDERAPQEGRLLESTGLRLARHFTGMERVLAEPIQAPELHPGIRLAPFSPALSDAVLRARNEAFRDHWGSQPLSQEAWRTLIGGPTFRPGLSFVAVARASGNPGGGPGSVHAGDELVGFLLGSVNRADWPHQGFTDSYVPMVGVRPGWRGRHIAGALIARHLEASRALGHERVTLDADTDRPTGVLRLYERLGFRRTHRKLAFILEV
jgi:ribosomal protein S18 acetylase RimI-like enzyme